MITTEFKQTPIGGFPKLKGSLLNNPCLYFAVGLAMLICCICAESPVANIVSVALFFGALIFIFVLKPGLIIKYLFFVFASCANIAGGVVCEFGNVTLPELVTSSHFVGSLPLLAFSWWLFFLTIYMFDKRRGAELSNDCNDFKIADSSSVPTVYKVAVLIEAIAILALFLHVVANPSFEMGVDRFAYAEMFKQGVWGKLSMWVSFGLVFPFVMLRIGRGRWRIISLVAIVGYCLYLFWTGEKFGGFFEILCIGGLCFYDKCINPGKKLTLKLMAALALCGLMLVSLTLFAYGFTRDIDGASYLNERLAQQGQLWWKTFSLTDGKTNAQGFDNEIKAIFSSSDDIKDNVGSQYGVYRIMYLAAPRDVVDKKLASGSRYTEAGFASSYYYFGAIGPPLFAIALGLIVALIQNALIKSIWRFHALNIFLLTRLSSIVMTVESMFTFSLLVSSLSILTYAVLIVELFAGKLSTNGMKASLMTGIVRQGKRAKHSSDSLMMLRSGQKVGKTGG